LSLARIIEQIAEVSEKARELRSRSEQPGNEISREFFRRQAQHYETLKSELEAMRATLEGIDARAEDILHGYPRKPLEQ
jgi:hypothetical protein